MCVTLEYIPSKLLPCLEEDSGKSTEENLVGSHLEAVDVGVLADLLLKAQVSLDVFELSNDVGVVRGNAEETLERVSGIAVAMALDEVTRRLGEDEHAESEDTCPDELDGDGDTERAEVVAGLGGLVHNGGQ